MFDSGGEMTAPCGVPSRITLAFLQLARRRPLLDQANDPAVTNPMLHDPDQPRVADGLEEGPDVGVQDPAS